MSEEQLSFQAEVSRLLHLMVNSVYSDKEVFLRELISNASDACDKLRYEALTEPALMGEDSAFSVTIKADKKAKTITVSDNGIGMNRDDLVRDLGTIARSGTNAYLENLSGDAKKDIDLVGQFGVGFYSVFMIAKDVIVESRKAGEAQAWRWQSDGLGNFTISECEKAERGTTITLHVKDDAKEWLEEERLTRTAKSYSDHIALPIYVDKGDDAPLQPINEAQALWTRTKSEISDEQYREFYHHVGHTFDDPWLRIHYRAEGKIEYSVLLFVPTQKPFDLFDPARRHRVKLYVKRVFITDECEGLVPAYLRFLRGIVDSEDLPLNISREMLQDSPILTRLRNAICRRVLSELKKKAEKKPEEFASFWEQFGPVLKEGIYEDADRRDDLLKLARFHSTTEDGLTSLADYVGRMKDKQSAIYYITGEQREALRKSPQLEGYAARGIEVLLLDDSVDDFWLSAVTDFDGKPFHSVTRGGVDLDAIAPSETPDEAKDTPQPRESELATLIALLKQNLGDAVKDVKKSERLTDSAVCLVADDGDMDMHLARVLKAHGQLQSNTPRILELNPRHELINALAARASQPGAADALHDVAHLLLDQARIIEGESLPDPAAFAQRMTSFLTKGLAPGSE